MSSNLDRVEMNVKYFLELYLSIMIDSLVHWKTCYLCTPCSIRRGFLVIIHQNRKTNMLAINSLARRTISSPLTREVAQQIKETTSSTIALRSIDQRGFLELQKRSYSTQKEGNAGRDKIYTGPFGTTVTGTQIVFGGGGVLFLLLAAFFGWVYCETQSEGELCESIRTKIGINKKINNIPEPASHCIERKQALERIEMLFSYSKRDPSVVAIVGDPASGKTELCKQYGRKHKNDYHHIWFVQIESWQKEYQNLARDWKLFSEKEIEEKEGMDNIDINSIIARVHNSFSREGRKKSLIIFENAPEGFIVDKLNGQLPKQTDILITSSGGVARPVP